MTDYLSPLIIKDCDSRLMETTIDVGWRIPLKNGNHADMMWGNTKDDASLRRLLVDIRKHYGQRLIIDERINTKGVGPLPETT